MCFGLPAPTTISSRFVAKIRGAAAVSPAAVTFAMFGSSAEAKTSAWAPLVKFATRVELPAKLSWTVAPSWRAWKSTPTWLKASVREAAANTLMLPRTGSVEAAGAATAPQAVARTARSERDTFIREPPPRHWSP